MTADNSPGRLPIYDAEFAADPAGSYARLRAAYGDFAPVELAPGVPATLVLGYDAALGVLRDPGTFPKDPRRWEQTIPPDCPVRPMMGYRPNALYTDGGVHARVRGAISDALGRVDTVALRAYVERSADVLIDGFAADGEADLRAQYTKVLPLLVFNHMFGCPPAIADRLVQGMIGIFELVDTEKADAELTRGVTELIELKRAAPGADVTSWMMGHPARLTDQEMADQLVLLMGAGTEPQQNLIANTLRLLLSDDRFAGDLSGGSLPIEDALDEVLWTDPPMANFGFTYPERDLERDGFVLPANQPVGVSFAAANTDPSKRAGNRAGNRAHLAFGAGPHTCPAKNHARLIASAAIEGLLDRLPDLTLAVPAAELQWRPGPFHRALASLPVRFTPVPVPVPVQVPAPAPAPVSAPAPDPLPAPSEPRRSRLLNRWRT
ncbi:cytochrome P450 [Actinocorallia sp. B10E7]|uniref:cytochrome P450 n=1 Tax=Actinocorallia sp. B10E7 TaxID=3153558 RepID=UPI00325CA29E